MRTCTTCNQKYEIGDTRVFAVSGHGVQELDDRSLTVSEHRSSATGRLHLPLWLRFKGLVDLSEVAFGIGKVCRAQPPGLVGWGSEKRDSLGQKLLVGGIDILNTGGQQHARPSLAGTFSHTDQQFLTTETILGLFHHSLGRSEKR